LLEHVDSTKTDGVKKYPEVTPISKSTGKRSLDSDGTENIVHVDDDEGSTRKHVKLACVKIEKEDRSRLEKRLNVLLVYIILYCVIPFILVLVFSIKFKCSMFLFWLILCIFYGTVLFICTVLFIKFKCSMSLFWLYYAH
jgi:hypothetical protein